MKNISFARVGVTLLLTILVLAVLSNLYSASQEAPLTHWQIFYSFVALSVLRTVTSFRAFKRGVTFAEFRENQKKAAMIKQLMHKIAERRE